MHIGTIQRLQESGLWVQTGFWHDVPAKMFRPLRGYGAPEGASHPCPPLRGAPAFPAVRVVVYGDLALPLWASDLAVHDA